MDPRIWNIRITDDSRTSRFAANELCRLLRAMDPDAAV